MNLYAYVGNDPVNIVDPNGEFGLGVAAKVLKVVFKGGDMASTFAGAVSDAQTLTSSDASIGERAIAAASLISEVASPVSLRDAKAAKNVLDATSAPKPISMDKAVDLGAKHVDEGGDMIKTGNGTNYQFTSTTQDAAGDTVTKNARFDVNPADPHVQRQGAHLNLETQVNGGTVSNSHIPVDPSTVRPGDIPDPP
jgi:hypothetical protein